MIEFTKKEISLCKQIAEKYRKEIEYADWYWSTSYNEPLLATDGGFKVKEQEHHGVFKIWTIPDCLKFLRKEGFMVRLMEYENHSGIRRIECNCYGHKTKGAFSTQGDKDEVACLKAVLAVLEEGKCLEK